MLNIKSLRSVIVSAVALNITGMWSHHISLAALNDNALASQAAIITTVLRTTALSF